MLGEGGCGQVCQVRHKLDNRVYALKKVRLHVKFDPDCEDCPQILNHPAMKEISAISKLNHKNIVGYKGCWIEAEELDSDRLRKIYNKLEQRTCRNNDSGETIEECEMDDPELALDDAMQMEVERKAF